MFQQLAGRAATAILGRVIIAAGGTLTPEGLAGASDDELRAAGLSWNKIAALRDLSAKVVAGVVNLDPSARDTDDAVIADLSTIRGIGPWSAKMFLMFELRRLDVWPVEDLGIRMGFGLIFGIDPPPTAKELVALGERFRPYRSVLARYCWAELERQRAGEGGAMNEIEIDDPRRADVRALLERHLAFAHENSPPEDVHALDVEGLLDPRADVLQPARRRRASGHRCAEAAERAARLS